LGTVSTVASSQQYRCACVLGSYSVAEETVEAVSYSAQCWITALKPGVNESRTNKRLWFRL
jgi:hypothetical protein